MNCHDLITINLVALLELFILIELVEVATVVVARLRLEHLCRDTYLNLIMHLDATGHALVVRLE